LLLLLISYGFKIYFDKLVIDLYKYEELNNHLQKNYRMRKIQNLVGAKALSNKEQLEVKGGINIPFTCEMEDDNGHCPVGFRCEGGVCVSDGSGR